MPTPSESQGTVCESEGRVKEDRTVLSSGFRAESCASAPVERLTRLLNEFRVLGCI